MLSCRTVAKHLRLRAAVVDIAALERSALEPKAKRQETLWGPIKLRSAAEEIAKRNVQVLLQSEIRQELSKRGAPLVGKPWELKARLAEIWQAAFGRQWFPASVERELRALLRWFVHGGATDTCIVKGVRVLGGEVAAST